MSGQPDRVLGFVGAPNFRDLGGYPTVDGRRTRWRLLFRSNRLNTLTDEDLDGLEALAIATVVDLRTLEERTSEPSRWRTPPRFILESPKPDLDEVRGLLMTNLGSVDDARVALQRFYGTIPTRYADEIATFFAHLAEGHGPAVCHCTAGKDRTGVTVALLLTALGVRREDVIDDYVLTGICMSAEKRAAAGQSIVGGAAGSNGFAEIPKEVRVALWQSSAHLIEAALDAAGPIEDYWRDSLGLDPAQLAAIRELYLEDDA
jgi:protein-tyrosine phosphatase